MELKYDWQTSCIDECKYDIFESVGGVVAYAAEWKYVEGLIVYFNSLS